MTLKQAKDIFFSIGWVEFREFSEVTDGCHTIIFNDSQEDKLHILFYRAPDFRFGWTATITDGDLGSWATIDTYLPERELTSQLRELIEKLNLLIPVK